MFLAPSLWPGAQFDENAVICFNIALNYYLA